MTILASIAVTPAPFQPAMRGCRRARRAVDPANGSTRATCNSHSTSDLKSSPPSSEAGRTSAGLRRRRAFSTPVASTLASTVASTSPSHWPLMMASSRARRATSASRNGRSARRPSRISMTRRYSLKSRFRKRNRSRSSGEPGQARSRCDLVQGRPQRIARCARYVFDHRAAVRHLG